MEGLKMKAYRGLRLAAVAAAALLIAAPAAWADRDHHGHGHWRGEAHGGAHGHGFDRHHREEHRRHYPRRYGEPGIAPRGYWRVPHRGITYYFSTGGWYRSLGPRLVVVAPPIGVVVPVLPPYGITVWAGGTPYYYAGGVYYVWNPSRHGYVTSARPFHK
jgi:hypothetical protein